MTKLEQNVMAGVRVIYMARKLTSPRALALYALALSVLGISLFVSLPNVATNFTQVASQGWNGISTFLLFAVLHTKVFVQLALVAGTLAFCALMVDIVRAGGQSRQFVA
jgi:hypothetical protein